jgi:hypothetical protein
VSAQLPSGQGFTHSFEERK